MPKRRIIDAHHHLWVLSEGYKYPWLQDKPTGEGMLGNLGPILHDYLVEDYLADAKSYDVVKSVHIEAVPARALDETAWLQGLADSTGFPHAIVAHADLNDPAVEAVLAAHAGCANVRGVRQIVNWHPNPKLTFTPADLLEDAQWRRGYALLRKYGLSFDLQLYPNQMHAATRLARANPETLVIVNHAGMPAKQDAAGAALWRDGMTAMAAEANIVAKISGLGMVDHHWNADTIRPFVLGTIDAFGPGRAMFGSNFPVDRLYGSFDMLYGAFEGIVDGFSEAEQDALFRGNAERWYRI